jgi:hypothetical protein
MQTKLWWNWSGGQFCIGTFVRDLALVAMNRFSYFIYFIKEFYKFCTLSAVCTMLSGSTVTTAWRVLGLRIEDTASRYGG